MNPQEEALGSDESPETCIQENAEVSQQQKVIGGLLAVRFSIQQRLAQMHDI